MLRLESVVPEQGGGDSCGREHDHGAVAVLPGTGGFNGILLFFCKKTSPLFEVEKHPLPVSANSPSLSNRSGTFRAKREASE